MRQAEKVDLGSDDWTMEIRPYASAFHFPIKELWEYRDLLFLFVRRDFKTMYKLLVLHFCFIWQAIFCGTIFQAA